MDIIESRTWIEWVITIAKFAFCFVPVLYILLLIPMERRGAGFMQDRQGPNRSYIKIPFFGKIRLLGYVQNMCDGTKLFFKEMFAPAGVNKVLYYVAPAIPFAIVGILVLLALTGTNLNIMSMMGGIMLAGIVVKNGIVLIDYTQLMRERGYGLIQSAVKAGRSRLRPVLMTTLTTILGMVPMAVGTGVGAEMWRPLGVSVIGGLTVGTLMTLIYVPTMFCIFGGVGIKRQRKQLKKQRELNEYYLAHKDKMVRDRTGKRVED